MQNALLALLVLVTVLVLLLLVMGVLVTLGGAVGVVEAVSLAILVGMSVDYVSRRRGCWLHLSVGFRCSAG